MAFLKFIITLSWRNLWRNHRRSLVMLSAIVTAAWAMIFSNALMRGMADQMLEDGINNLPGYVQIHHPSYLDDPSIVNSMPAPDAAWKTGMQADKDLHWSARIKVPAVISSERESRGVQLVGIDPVRESDVGFSSKKIVEGRYLESTKDRGVVLGVKLAERLKTKLGHRVVLMSQDPENNVADRGFRVVGLFRGDLEAQELSQVYIALGTAQSMLNANGLVSEVAIKSGNFEDVASLLALTKQHTPTELQVKAWYELDAYMGSMQEMMDGFVMVWVIIIFIALSFGLVNTLIMAVFERTREVGLMLALGMKPGSVVAMFVAEMLWLLLLGLILGNALALATLAPLADGIDISVVGEGMEMFGYGAVLTPSLTQQDMVMANIVVLVLGILTSLFPSWRASRLDPVEAIVKV